MAQRPRDNQRSRVLAAERVFTTRLDNPLSGRQLQSLADRITKSAWFRKKELTFTAIVVFTGATTYCGQPVKRGLLTITLGDDCSNAPGLLHEIAHHMAPNTVQLHGPEYCKAMLECVRKWIGPEQKKVLLADYHTPPRCKTRVITPEGRAALRETAAKNLHSHMTADLAALLNELSSTD